MVPRQRPITVPGSTAAETAGTPIDYRLAEKAGVSLGTVVGAPRLWLQLEGVTLLAGSLVAFSSTHRSRWLVPLVLFLPDLFMAGRRYANRGARVQPGSYDHAAGTDGGVRMVTQQTVALGLGPGMARTHRNGPSAHLRTQVPGPLPAHPSQ